jgi:capping protein alpha
MRFQMAWAMFLKRKKSCPWSLWIISITSTIIGKCWKRLMINRSGKWRSVWHFSLESFELKGSVKIHVHYFEDGNVQMTLEKDFVVSVTPKEDPKDLAKVILQKMKESEAKLQQSLNESYTELSETAFKSLRRALPITRSKMDWNAVSNYRLGAELKQ